MSDFPKGDLVTIYQLLNHTSGIKNFTRHKDFQKDVSEYITQKDMIKHIKSLGYDFLPGEKALYTNSGYYIYSAIN